MVSYQESLIRQANLGPVIESHNDYTSDTDFLATVGASNASVNSHDDSLVPRVGVRRSSALPMIGDDARSTPTYTKEQVLTLEDEQRCALTWGGGAKGC